MTLSEIIVALNKIWYDLIGPIHHKDRDCHFKVVEMYSYGDRIMYSVEHYGYLLDHYFEDFDTKVEAEKALIKYLGDAIVEWVNIEREESLGDEAADEILDQVKNLVAVP